MAHEIHGKAVAESLTEQELHELLSELANDNEAEAEMDSEEENELSPEEIEADALDAIELEDPHEHAHHAHAHARRRARLARFVLRQMVRAILRQTRVVVRRMHRNASLRRKLVAATRRGPRAVRALIGLAVLRTIPRPFRPATRRLIPLVIGLSFRMIARHAGLNACEADAAELESENS